MWTVLLIVGGLSFAAGIWVGQLGGNREDMRDDHIDWQS